MELLGWLVVVQGHSWPLIEFAGDGIEVLQGMHREVGPFREVLSKKMVGVLISAALPGAMRIAEVDVEVGGPRQALVIRQFFAGVPGFTVK